MSDGSNASPVPANPAIPRSAAERPILPAALKSLPAMPTCLRALAAASAAPA